MLTPVTARTSESLTQTQHIPSKNSKKVGRVLIFGAVENAFDNVYDIGRTPVLTIGLPRTFRAGIHVDLA